MGLAAFKTDAHYFGVTHALLRAGYYRAHAACGVRLFQYLVMEAADVNPELLARPLPYECRILDDDEIVALVHDPDDPTVGGPGRSTAVSLYVLMGEEFVRKLYGEQMATTRDPRQGSDWLARGTYPISLALVPSAVDRLRQEGFPIEVVDSLPDLTGWTSGGFGLCTLVEGGPHPNAARLFQNWMHGREAQQILVDYARQYSPHAQAVEKPGIRKLSDIKLMKEDAEGILAQADAVKKRYAEIFKV